MPRAQSAPSDLETIDALASRLKLRAALLTLQLAELIASAPWLRAIFEAPLRICVRRLARSFKGVLVLQALAFTHGAPRDAAARTAPKGFRLAQPRASALRRLTRGLFTLRGDLAKRVSTLRTLMNAPQTLLKKLIARVKRGLWRARLVLAAALKVALFEGAAQRPQAAADTS